MKLAIVPLVVLILLVSSLCVTLNVVQASTDVRGTIDSNRTWTSSGSPYSLSAPVTVASGVTLTIQPGVIVQLNGFILTVNGTLTVNQATIDGGWTIGDRFFGTKEEHTGSVIFRETSSGSSITGSNLKQPSIIVNGDLKFSGNSLSGVGMAVYSGYPEISKKHFHRFEARSSKRVTVDYAEYFSQQWRLGSSHTYRWRITANIQ